MTVFLTLTIAGANVGPFNLYSNIDGYTTAFETNVAKEDLTGGYASDLVPDGTTTIRLLSTGECNNYFDIFLVQQPIAPNCPDRRVVFQICNENSERDDNFDIYLNGIYIGAVDLNSDTQVGSIFIADLDNAITVTSSDFACPLIDMVTYHFDPLILSTSNILEMRNTQNNNNGNAGTIGIRNYTLSELNLIDPCVITDLTYDGPSGDSFTFNFDYTSCCSTTTTTSTVAPTTTSTTTSIA